MEKNKLNKEQDIEKISDNKKFSDGIIPDEILEIIPEEERGKFASIFKQTMISGVMRSSNPIADKVTPEHITQIISRSDEQDKRDREEKR